MKDTIRYIISFLLYGNEEALPLVGYTTDEEEAKKYKVNIRPSDNSPLVHPEKSWEAFYPEVKRVLHGRSVTADTDIVSIACFLLSRAEETIISERDEHGRFLAKHSMLSEGNLLNIPIIDEYSRWLLKRLELPLPAQKMAKINITHDVDTIANYRHLRGFLGGIKRGEMRRAILARKNIEADPAFTFPWLFSVDSQLKTLSEKADNSLPSVDIIYFLKAGNGKLLDYPQYSLSGKDFGHMMYYISKAGAKVGLHTSYAAGLDGNLINQEKQTLEKALSAIKYPFSPVNRYHWLRCTSIDNMQQLASAGITDDYTMGFADRAGFRLCTARPVRWINPKTLQLTSLTLHPLTIMDCTLSNQNYMNLSEEEAFYLCQQLIDKTSQCNGELTLLWHNSNLTEDTYHKSLYHQLLDYIAEI